MSVTVNRPFSTTFDSAFALASKDINKFDQVSKLIKNHIVSLDLGCVNLRMVRFVDKDVDTEKMTIKEKYYEWVRTWKIAYNHLSKLIRHYKMLRTLSYYNEADFKFSSYENYVNNQAANIGWVKESAQIMLNARFNAKLAWKASKILTNS